jgi:coenzyme F420-0:L-glutamate ligase / coenzyme F420-1:gamma-L-glutamate ligase
MPLVLTALPGFPLVQPGANLPELIWGALLQADVDLQNGDILVIAQKIISKAEGRIVHLSQVEPSKEACELATSCEKDPRLVEWVLRESHSVLRIRPGTIIVEHRLGFVCANAGIDHSNVSPPPGGSGQLDPEGWLLLLPVDPDASAAAIRRDLEECSGKRLGVLIIDSHGRAWRLGTVGTTIGLSGLPGLVDLRGEPDLFNYKLRITQVGVADELAGFPYPMREAALGELLRPRDQDLFR